MKIVFYHLDLLNLDEVEDGTSLFGRIVNDWTVGKLVFCYLACFGWMMKMKQIIKKV